MFNKIKKYLTKKKTKINPAHYLQPHQIVEAINNNQPFIQKLAFMEWTKLMDCAFNYNPWPSDDCPKLYCQLYEYQRQNLKEKGLENRLFFALRDKIHECLENGNIEEAYKHGLVISADFLSPGYLILSRVCVKQGDPILAIASLLLAKDFKAQYGNLMKLALSNAGIKDDESFDSEMKKQLNEICALLQISTNEEFDAYQEEHKEEITNAYKNDYAYFDHDKLSEVEKKLHPFMYLCYDAEASSSSSCVI